ncbi:MAG: hypothetical protein JWM49_2536 [Microbacteriaceae bacterium]|nr:hypothetical protein [Microbacteriaceae bacterium]
MTSISAYIWQLLWEEGTCSQEWSHSGIAVLPDGRVVFSAPEGGDLVFVSPDGGSSTTLTTGLLEIHGISVDPESPRSLWLADPGEKPRPERDYAAERRQGRVLNVAIDASSSFEFTQPDRDEYRSAPWRPTSVVGDGQGGVWVADGYGASLVHKFDRAGRLLFTLTGAETGQQFDCPHGLVLDDRSSVHRLVVADRGNRRLVFYRLDGNVDRIVNDPLITSPSCLAVLGDKIVFTELRGGILALGRNDTLSVVVEVPDVVRGPAWPNALRENHLVRPDLSDQYLNSPHGVAVGTDGSIFLTEWMIGGRQIRLKPAVLADSLAR